MSEISAFDQLNDEQKAVLTEEHQATYLALDPRDQQFASRIFSPKDLPVYLARKREQMLSNERQRQRLAAIEQRMSAAAATATAESETKIGGALAGVGAAVGLGGAAMLASKKDDVSIWSVENPSQAIEAALRRLGGEFARKEKTDLRIDKGTDITHAYVQVARRSQRDTSLNPSRDLLNALDITFAINRTTSEVRVEVGELNKETLFDAAKIFSKRGLNILMQGARVITRRGRVNPMDMIGMAGSTLDAAFDIGQAAKDLDLKKRTWSVLGDVMDPLEAAYKDLLRDQREQEHKLIGLWDQFFNCPTCGVPFMAEDVQCRVCHTERPPMPKIEDPRRQIKG